MNWLEPSADYVPEVATLDGYRGARLVFNIGGSWLYYASFTVSEYLNSLEALVQAASLALGGVGEGATVGVSLDPVGARWSEWLLSMENWEPGRSLDPEWDLQVLRYAFLFENGTIPMEYAGACITRRPRTALRFCADLVIRNLAPASWLFQPAGGGVTVYFHNTTSLGVCVPGDGSYDAGALITRAKSLGLELA